jgi:UDP-N-acetylglucosamine 2-epimerase (non-hydrolysing)
MAPVISEALRRDGSFKVSVRLTAQHRLLLNQVIDLSHIPVAYERDLMQANQTFSEMTRRILSGVEGILGDARPDVVLVHDDTMTSFAAALRTLRQDPRGPG